MWIRRLTVPPCVESENLEEYDHVLTLVWPYLGIPATYMLAMNGPPDSWWYLLYLVVAVLWTLLFYLIHRGKERNEIPSGYIVIAFVGMVVGLVWTYWVSGVLIDILTLVGTITKLPATYLALTIIAVGNALPDALMTITMAKNGKAILGITGSYAGQLFGLLIGFGLA